MSSTKPLLFVLGAGLLLATGACQDDETPWSPGGGYQPGTPGGKPDGGNIGADGGVALGRPCTTGSDCAGACSDGGTVCAGNCGFLAPVAYRFPTSAGLEELVAVDVTGDGYEDLLTVNDHDEAVALLLNRGDGSFAAPTLVPAGKLDALRVEDLDGDGTKDLAVVSESSG
ncbi:MAG TPA: VCBS repeat-containing protein, partial [Myxococcaceae bacterium]|nr:VCBS repeat-containing protein [Myxococcaceae bacterium]